MRGDSAERQLRLLQLIDQRRELEVPVAAAALNCTVRTIYRDLGVLERFGVPLYQEKSGARSRWRLAEGYRHRVNLSLTWSEMLALTAGGGLLSGLTGTLFHESALTALEKLRGALPPPLLQRVRATEARVSATTGARRGYEAKKDVLQALLEAVEKSETVELGYRALTEERERQRVVDPYNLHVQADGVYLMGWSHERDAGRIFLLDRVGSVRRTGKSFARRAEFQPAQYLHGAFGPWDGSPADIHLRFTRKVARLVAERSMHPSQVSQHRADGGLDVKMKCPVSPAVKAWVRGFGAEVKVLAPKGWANAV